MPFTRLSQKSETQRNVIKHNCSRKRDRHFISLSYLITISLCHTHMPPTKDLCSTEKHDNHGLEFLPSFKGGSGLGKQFCGQSVDGA